MEKLPALFTYFSLKEDHSGTCRVSYIRGYIHAKQGDLSQAIFNWKTLLEFEAASSEVKKATDLALENGFLTDPWEL